MSIAQNFGSTGPSLLLDFANTKTLDPRITFTRASTATFYDGKSVAKAEENLVLRSQEFDNASWTKANATITASATTAPDGTSTAATLTCTANNNGHEFYQNVTFVSGAQYVMSVFAKKNTHDFIQLRHYTAVGGTTRFANFNLATGVLGTVGADATASITDVGNGWYRCVMIAAVTGAAGGADFWIIPASTSASGTIFSAAGTESIYIWGAQLEQRSSVTAYTPTTTQPITNYIPVLQTAASGVARFDHNPTTGESLGLLIEEQRANLLTYSQNFSEWTANASSVTLDTIGPDGTLSAFTYREDTTSGYHYLQRLNLFSVDGVTRTWTLYVKAGTAPYIAITSYGLDIQTAGATKLVYNTSTNTYSAWDSLVSPIDPVNVGNGWYRIGFSSSVNNSNYDNFRIEFNNTGTLTTGSANYLGQGRTVKIWGAQLEAGAFPTSYIKTEASQVTRSADAASMTGTNFSSWYRQDEVTIYVESIPGSGGGLFLIDDTTANNRIAGSANASNGFSGVRIDANGANQADMFAGTTVSANTLIKLATAFKVNDAVYATNGTQRATDASLTLPVVTRALFGTNQSSQVVNGTIKKIAYYPLRLSNANLKALTS